MGGVLGAREGGGVGGGGGGRGECREGGGGKESGAGGGECGLRYDTRFAFVDTEEPKFGKWIRARYSTATSYRLKKGVSYNTRIYKPKATS